MTPERALSTVQKLLRVAASGSGASEHERSNAALHACQLITEHDLLAQKEKPRAREEVRAPRGPRMSDLVNAVIDSVGRPTAFRRSVAAEDCACGVETCALPIFEGETVWRRYKDGHVEYVHADCWTR